MVHLVPLLLQLSPHRSITIGSLRPCDARYSLSKLHRFAVACCIEATPGMLQTHSPSTAQRALCSWHR
ncbi:MAG: hypothetical protein ACK559_37445, partial [bacterium]